MLIPKKWPTCPSCHAVWTITEVKEEQCFACGYPADDTEDDELDNDFDYE